MNKKPDALPNPRESFQMPFGNGEIWFEHLDALFSHTDMAMEQFKRDMGTVNRPSTSAFIAVNLTETLLTGELAALMVREFRDAASPLHKIVFVGLNRRGKRQMLSLLRREPCAFSYCFMDDFEQAKRWLMG